MANCNYKVILKDIQNKYKFKIFCTGNGTLTDYYTKEETNTLLANKEDTSNKVTSMSSSSTDTQYPSAKAVYDSQDAQDTQISNLQEENDYLTSIINQLPKVTGEGTDLTLNNTLNAKLDLDLKGNTYQDSTTGATLGVTTNYTKTISDVNFTTDANNIITINGTTSDAINSAATDFVGASYTIPSGNCYWHCQYISGTVSYKSGETSGGIFINLRGSGRQQINGNSYQIKPTDYTQTKTKIYTLESDEIYDRIQFMSSNTLIFNNLKLRVWLSSSESETYEPYTNGASPNPDYPQEIEVVTGNNTIKVEGKNLANGIPYQANSVIQTNGTISSNNNNDVFKTIVKPNTTYTLSITSTETTDNRDTRIVSFKADGTYIEATVSYKQIKPNITTTQTFTTPSEANYILYHIPHNSKELQIEEGNTATTYEAYKGQTYPISLDYTNLFKKQDISSDDLNKRLNQIGEDYNENGYFISPFIKVDKDTQYTINYTPTAYTRICYYASNNINSFISKNDDTSSFTTPSTCQYLRFCNLMADIDNIRLEKGSTITNNYIELCKIGTYQDRIYKNNGNWYLHKEIGKVVLTGGENENWNRTVTNNIARFELSSIDYLEGNSYVTNLPTFLSNNFTKQLFNNIANGVETGISWWWSSSLKLLIIGFQDNRSLQDFKTWLSTHNTTVYYVLATATETQITDTTLISQLEAIKEATSYSPQTNISQVYADAPFVITASTLLDLSSILNDLETRVSVLETE